MEPQNKKQKVFYQEKKQKVTNSEVADLSITEMNPNTKKQKLSESQELIHPDLKEAMKKQNDISMILMGKVVAAAESRNSNLVFSPASISAVLTMAAATCSEEAVKSNILSYFKSSSLDELNAVFSRIATVVLPDGSASGGPQIAAVNGVWIDQSLNVDTSSKDLLVNFFKSEFAQVDFGSKAEEMRKEVNAWASRHTNGLIKKLLPPGSVTSLTKWIYGNALYFKGAWELKFDKSLTKRKEFYLLNGKTARVPFMSSDEKQYIKAYDGFKVLQLYYREGHDDTTRKFSMYFYLPDEKNGLDNLLERMTSTSEFLDSHIPNSEVKVGKFRIPKFKIKFGFEASKIFSDMELKTSLYQKASIEIDEDGTEAAAATAISMMSTYCKPKRIDFVADHPFLFLIREEITGTILFVGQILDPSKSS